MALSYISEKINIFFSVASTPQDRNLFNELQKHLSLQRHLGLIEIWYDSAFSISLYDILAYLIHYFKKVESNILFSRSEQ